MPRMDAATSTLLVVDVQEKLHPAIHDGQAVLERCLWLVHMAKQLGVPVIASEQYPEGLGPTVEPLRSALPADGLRRKLHFSCVAEGCFADHPAWERPQIVVCGTEAHVCVLQTVLDLREAGRQVFVVADAVSSRVPLSKQTALDRMRQHGVEVVTGEMVGFEWLRRAGDDRFRSIHRAFLR